MNEAQTRVVRFAGVRALIGLATGFVVSLATSNAGGLGKAELFITLSFLGMLCGVIAAWFANLR